MRFESKKFQSVILLSLVVFSMFVFNNIFKEKTDDNPNIPNNPDNPPNNPERSFLTCFNQLGVSAIKYYNDYASSSVKVRLEGWVANTSTAAPYGTVNVAIKSFTTAVGMAAYIREAGTGEESISQSQVYAIESVNALYRSASGYAYFSNTGYINGYLVPTTGMDYADADITYAIEITNYNDQYSTSLKPGVAPVWGGSSPASLSYNLYLDVIINSSHYSKSNTKLYLCTLNTGSWEWAEYEYNSAVVKYPLYKIKIVDTFTNNTIYEDSANRYYATRQTITIASVKLQNNANEPINATLKENPGHYQGSDSFDFDIVNTAYNKNLTLDDYKKYALDWGISGAPSGILIDGAMDTYEVISSYILHDYPVHFIADANEFAYQTAYGTSMWFSEWIYPTGKSFFVGVSKSGGGWCQLFMVHADGNIYAYQNPPASESTIVGTYSVNTWYHLAIHYVKDAALTYYINGVKVLDGTVYSGTPSMAIITYGLEADTEVYTDAVYQGSSSQNAFASLIDADVRCYNNGFGNITHIINTYQNHNKVLNLTGTLGFRLPQSTGNFEFWLNSQTTTNVLINGTNIMIPSSSNVWTHYNYYWNESSSIIRFNSSLIYLDAIDWSFAPGYFLGRNYLINQSTDLWNWNAFPEYNSTGHYQGSKSFNFDTINNIPADWTSTNARVNTTFVGHNQFLNITAPIPGTTCSATQTFSAGAQLRGIIDFFWAVNNTSDSGQHQINFLSATGTHIMYILGGWLRNYGTTNTAMFAITINQWYHIQFIYDVLANRMDVYVDGLLKDSANQFRTLTTGLTAFKGSIVSNTTNMYLDAVDYSWDVGYFPNRNQLENTTAFPLAMTTNFSLQANPYTSAINNFTLGNYLYRIADLYNETLEINYLNNTQNSITYNPPNLRECLISYADQQGIYQEFNNFKTYVNGSLILSQYISREQGDNLTIETKDRYGISVQNSTYVVQRQENFIAITLTMYTVKVYNQQQCYNWINVSRDPNYYTSNQYWSEWLYPGECGEYKLFGGYYKIALQSNENNTWTNYSLTVNSDDILLLSSGNTLANIIANVNNINTTLGTQFTYIALNFTNTNSAIGNQTTIISINFANINSTFDDILLSQQNSFVFLNSTINTLFLTSENSFLFQNTTLNSLYNLNQNSFVFINSSVIQLIADSQNSFTFLNSSVNNIYAMSYSSFEYLNSSIANSITYMAQNFTFLNTTIGNNQLAILTQFSIVNSNITNMSIDLMNNLLAVNSSIANMISNLESNVLLVNNSIYTAVLNVSTNLALDSNSILGNISITYMQNEFLTDLFKKTMFSELLNWTGVGYNATLITGQIDLFDFVNQYRNETLLLELRYQNQTNAMIIAAQNTASQMLPKTGVQYRVKSMATGEYLEDWTDLTNKTVELGFYNETLAVTPDQIKLEIKDYLMIALFAVVALAAITILYIKAQGQLEAIPPEKRKEKKKAYGVRDDTPVYFGSGTRSRRTKSKSNRDTIVIVAAIIVICFVVVYLAIRFGV